MRHLLKYAQRGGLVSALLIGGVLGGLLAPLASDAGTPTLTLLIDGQPLVKSTGEIVTGNSILGPSVACSTADVNLGYTACYSILTSTTIAYKANTGRLYRIQNAPNATARLRVGDNVGQDNFSLVGVQFVPVLTAAQSVTTVTNWGTAAANTTEQHILTITMKNKFDSAVNVDNATGLVVGSTTVGQLAYGMRSGGEFRSAPLSTPVPTTTLFCTTGTTAARCNTVGDSVVFTGKGIFSGTTSVDILSPGAPTANNSTPLSLTVGAGSAASSIVSYDGLTNPTVGQVSLLYPKFNCVDFNAPTKCQPDITLTMTVTLKGPDTFVLVNGQDAFGAICTFVDNSKLTKVINLVKKVRDFLVWVETFHPSAHLQAIIGRINAFLANFNSTPDPTCPGATYIEAQSDYNALIDQVAFAADGAVPADPAPLTHEYRVVSLPGATWGEARAAAQLLGPGWDLATITSAGEQSIINSLLPDPTSFTSTRQYWIGGEQQIEAFEPGGKWQWINEEGIFWDIVAIDGQYQNWGNEVNGPGVGLQPDNAGPQNHLALDNRYGWGWDDNDQTLWHVLNEVPLVLGYVAERVVPVIP